MVSNALGQTLWSNHSVKSSNLLVKLAWSNPHDQTHWTNLPGPTLWATKQQFLSGEAFQANPFWSLLSVQIFLVRHFWSNIVKPEIESAWSNPDGQAHPPVKPSWPNPPGQILLVKPSWSVHPYKHLGQTLLVEPSWSHPCGYNFLSNLLVDPSYQISFLAILSG